MSKESGRADGITDGAIREAYGATGSIWRAGESLGCSGQKVQSRLAAMGVERSGNSRFTPEETRAILTFYMSNADAAQDEMKLAEFAERLGRTKGAVSQKARAMGLTKRGRRQSGDAKANVATKARERIAKQGHPRGALGMRHTEEAKRRKGEAAKEYWNNVTEKELEARYLKAIATRKSNGGAGFPNVAGGGGYAACKRGYRDDLGGLFFRSAWEANWARYLNFLVDTKTAALERWEFEPDRFWFEPIRSGITSYLPDFKLFERGAEPYYHEVKGRMDAKSKTRLKRMAKYYPDVKVDLIDAKAYREVEKKLGPAIPGWEFAG